MPSVNASLEGAFEQRTVNKTGRVTVKRSLYAPTDASFGAHVSAVIASGADLDVRDDDGMPLLLLATLRRDHRAVRELLVAGANPSLSGKAYFVHSHDNGFPQLVNRWTPDTPWQLAVHLRELPVMKALLDANADTTNRKESVLAVNMVMDSICRFSQASTRKRLQDTAVLLFNAGYGAHHKVTFDVGRYANSYTVLFVAAEYGLPDVALAALRAGCDLGVRCTNDEKGAPRRRYMTALDRGKEELAARFRWSQERWADTGIAQTVWVLQTTPSLWAAVLSLRRYFKDEIIACILRPLFGPEARLALTGLKL